MRRKLKVEVGFALAGLMSVAACGGGSDGNPFGKGETGDTGMSGASMGSTETMSGQTQGDDDTTGGEQGVCGDGQVDDGEICDDANDDDSDGCTSMCTASGGFLWEVDVGTDTAKAVGVGASGRVAIGFDQTILGETHSFVAAHDPDGTQVWVVEVGIALPDSEVGDVAVSALGEVVVAGHGEIGGFDTGFVEVLDPNGIMVVGGPISTGNSGEYLSGVAISPSAEVFAAGTFRGPGGGAEPFQGFVAKYNATVGGLTQVWRWSGPDDSRMTGLVRSEAGRVFAAGGLRTADGWNARIYELGNTGTPAWLIEGHPSAPSDDNAFGLAHLPGDGVYVAVQGEGGGGQQGFFVRVDDDGENVGTFAIEPGSKGDYVPLAVDAAPGGTLAVTGYLQRDAGGVSGWSGGITQDGQSLWTHEIRPSTVFSRGDDVAVGPDGTIFVVATVEGNKRVKLIAYAP